MTPVHVFKAVGVLAVWDGNEEALTVANPAIEVEGRVVVTRGEGWTSPNDLSRTDVSDDVGFVSTDPIEIFEGDVVWLAGPSYVSNYRALLELGVEDHLEIDGWQTLQGGWLIYLGGAALFYETGAEMASSARQWWQEALGAGESPTSAGVLAARVVDTGSPGVARGDRRLADAVWYSLVGDFDLHSRAVHLAASAYDRPETEIKDLVQERVHFYQTRARSTKRRSRETNRLRMLVTQLREQRLVDKTTIRKLEASIRELAAQTGRAGVKAKHVPLDVVTHGPSNMFGAKTKNAMLSQVSRSATGKMGLINVTFAEETLTGQVTAHRSKGVGRR